MPHLVVLIASEATVGAGVEGDPIRRVSLMHTYDGRLVARRDTWSGDSFVDQSIDDLAGR